MPGGSQEELDNAGLVDLTVSKAPSPSKTFPKCEKTPEKTVNSDQNKSNESRTKKKSQSAGKYIFHVIVYILCYYIGIYFRKKLYRRIGFN